LTAKIEFKLQSYKGSKLQSRLDFEYSHSNHNIGSAQRVLAWRIAAESPEQKKDKFLIEKQRPKEARSFNLEIILFLW